MFRSFFKTGWRSIKKNRLYSFINIAGLTVGLTSCILIGLYITDELSFDKFNANANSLVRVTMEYSEGSTINKMAVTGTKVAPQMKRTFSFVKDAARTITATRTIKYGDKLFTEKNVLYADAPFFSMFSFGLQNANPADVLNGPNKIVLTQSMAKKYFGDENPVGKALELVDRGTYQVTGVCKDAPANSQIPFDFVASFTSLGVSKTEDWWSANDITYLLLQPNTDVHFAEAQIDGYMRNTVGKDLNMHGSSYLTYHLEPLLSVHLHSNLSGLLPNGNINYIVIMLVIGILILSIACINYTNLTTAQSAGRLGEISMRKVMGAQRWQLFMQFIGESVLVTLIALSIAVAASVELLPFFNSITGKAILPNTLLSSVPLVAMLLLALLVGFVACVYPAVVLSGKGLSKNLKSGFSFSKNGNGLRKGLIVMQFSISMFLIIATIVVQEQLHYIQNKNLGYDKSHLLVLPVTKTIAKKYDDFKSQLSQLTGVESASGAYEVPTYIQWGDGIRKSSTADDKGISVNAIPVDKDFVKTMKIHLIAGSDFTKDDYKLMDTSDKGKNYHYSFIINQSAAKQLGWAPEQAIGKTVYKGSPGTIKAVVEDFHFSSLHDPIKPLVIFLNDDMLNDYFVRINGANTTQAIAQVKALWQANEPTRPFEYHFLDDDYNKLYITEQKTSDIFTTFATLAIVLACLGLFGLAAFTTVQRTKEIGIRKVVGASVATIVSLLCTEFLQLVLIAFVIAVPIGWLAANKWLQDFAYRINISLAVFIITGIAVTVVTMLTVGYHAVKAGLTNPVTALRSE